MNSVASMHGLLVHSVLGHSRTPLTCAYSFPSSIYNDDFAGNTDIRVQVDLSDTNPFARAAMPSVLRLTPVEARLSPNTRAGMQAEGADCRIHGQRHGRQTPIR